MSLTTKNQLLIAFKKLVGKAHTNSQFGSANESVGSNVQLDNSTIFSQPIPSSPNTALYSTTNDIVERVQFNLVSISLSQYTAVGAAGGGITADGDGAPTQGTFTNGIHAYALALPANYTTLSSNPKKGTGVFINGQSLTGSNGLLQIVPERYGSLYPASVSSSIGIVAALDEEDYLLDPYSGILFVQDINRVPTSVTAYIYIGDYLNQTVSGTTAQFTTISGSTVTGSTALFTTISGAHFGSGAGLTNITASGISNFTNDVRAQFSAGTNITIVGGVISSTGGGGGGTPGGTDTTVQFNSGSTFSGSTNLVYDYTTNILSGTIARFTVVTASFTGSGAGLTGIPNSGLVNSNITVGTTSIPLGSSATTIQGVSVLTGSTVTGSTALFTTVSGALFGSGAGITGIPNSGLTNSSITVGTTVISLGSSATTIQGISVLTGSLITGSTALFTSITGNLLGTASFATNAGNANTVTNGVYTNTNNTFTGINTFNTNYITGSITGSDAKFTSISGSHTGSGAGLFGIPTTALTSNTITVGSTSIALGGTATTIQGISVLTGSTVTGSTALFTSITGNLFGTASFATNAGNANTVTNGVYTNTNNTFTGINTFNTNYITGSITGSDAKFTSISGSHTGSGAGLFNITASGISNFTSDVRSQFSAGTNITIVGGVISSTGGGGGGTPGGINTTVQFNSGSTFSGSTNLVYDYITNTLSGTTAQFSQITASSIRTAFITSSNIDTDYIDFNGTNGDAAWQTGRLYYNTASNLLSVYTEVPDLKIHLGEQLAVRVQNDLPTILAKGKVIQITGSSSSDVPRVITASWDNDVTSARTLAVVMEDIAVGGRGYALLSGLFEGLNTNAYLPGQMLYLSSSGDITNVHPPAPYHEVRIGQVVRKQTNNGSIFVRIQNGYELEELHDVELTLPQNGDLLTYQTSPYNQWVNSKTLSGSYNITNALTASTIAATTITASFTGSGAGLFNLTASGISNFTNDVRSQFSAGTNITIVGGVISSTGGGGGGSPGGSDTAVQFNSGSTFSGSTNLVYNYNTNILSGTTAQFTIITSSFTGSGAGLYDITSSGINNFTNDVRAQFSAGANITINAGVISATTGSVIGSVITVTGNYIVLTTDDRIFTDGTLTLTLPSAVGSSGKSYYIKNIGTGSVTVTGTLGQKIDGYDNMIITEQNSAFGLLSNNIGWYIF